MAPEKGAVPGTAPGKNHEKSDRPMTTQDVELENGHLVELEVDLGGVLAHQDGEEGDYSADTSPFPAVRAVVPETDDTGMPVSTFRAWFLGIVRAAPVFPLSGTRTPPLRLTWLRSSSSWAPV